MPARIIIGRIRKYNRKNGAGRAAAYGNSTVVRRNETLYDGQPQASACPAAHIPPSEEWCKQKRYILLRYTDTLVFHFNVKPLFPVMQAQ